MSAIKPVAVIPKRKSLTKAQRVRVFDQGGGCCHLCGLPIQHGESWEAEHPEFRAGGGSDKIEDLRPAHVDCHKPKTAADKKTLAKTNRTRAGHIGAKGPSPMAGRDRETITAQRIAQSKRVSPNKFPIMAPRRSLFQDA